MFQAPLETPSNWRCISVLYVFIYPRHFVDIIYTLLSYRVSHKWHGSCSVITAWQWLTLYVCLSACLCIGVASNEELWHVPLDFQLLIFQVTSEPHKLWHWTLCGRLYRKNIQTCSFVTVYCMNLTNILCVTHLNYFLLVLCPSSQQILATPLCLGSSFSSPNFNPIPIYSPLPNPNLNHTPNLLSTSNCNSANWNTLARVEIRRNARTPVTCLCLCVFIAAVMYLCIQCLYRPLCLSMRVTDVCDMSCYSAP